MLHPAKARVASPIRAARAARSRLAALARPARDFDASRYFRGAGTLGFYNVSMPVVRQMGKAIARAHRDDWSVDDAGAFAEVLMADRYLEVKALGIEVLACYQRAFAPRHLRVWKRWLANNWSANWATTDGVCGMLLGPLLIAHPALVAHTRAWSRHRNLWVRRASVVSIIGLARRGQALDSAYAMASVLHADHEDLIQKAVGWMLREAGKADPVRLEHYLRANGPRIPRTTLRYAIERFPPAKRKDLLTVTRRVLL
jgi:3-methyladenine DNA glycosylase AlkD